MSDTVLPSDRKFGFVIGGALMVASAISTYHQHAVGPYFGGAGLLFILAACFFPSVLHPLNRGWMALGRLMGMVVTPIILGLLFFVLFTPIGMLMRLFGRDALRMKLDRSGASYWVAREQPGSTPESFREQG